MRSVAAAVDIPVIGMGGVTHGRHAHDLIAAGSLAKAREAGKVRLEGKDYVVRDGDVILFRFNV